MGIMNNYYLPSSFAKHDLSKNICLILFVLDYLINKITWFLYNNSCISLGEQSSTVIISGFESDVTNKTEKLCQFFCFVIKENYNRNFHLIYAKKNNRQFFEIHWSLVPTNLLNCSYHVVLLLQYDFFKLFLVRSI